MNIDPFFSVCSRFLFFFQKSSTGSILLNKVCEKLNLLEKEYFSLSFRELNDVKVSYWK